MSRPAAGWQHVLIVAAIGLAGFLAVSPAVRGDFLSGDDVHLLRDHVLVNHPSLAHALQLFVIVHRDLYQPLHLLSFQLDFLFRGLDPQGMHVTNLALHLINACLVYAFIRQVTASVLVGGLTGLLFAVHPMAVESVAWLNGRTMLLSTGFVLAGMVAFDRWDGKGGWWRLVLSLLLFVATMMSKIRVELPVLLVLILVIRRRWPDRRWWIGWALATAVAAGFSAFALRTTDVSEMIEQAEEVMQGSRWARAFESLGWYFVHYAAPVGLSPWHPPRLLVSWSDPSVLVGIGLCLLLAVAAVLLWRRDRTLAVGYVWFVAAIFSTLQIIATRAVLAGERYAYLPIVGLHWIAAAGLAWALSRLGRWRRTGLAASAGTLLVAGVVVPCAALSRHTTSYYRSDLAKAERIAEVYPDTPDVFKDLAWAYIRAGEPHRARHYARQELTRPQSNRSAALQALAWTYYLEKDYATAEKHLLEARQADAQFGKVYYRLAAVYEALGRDDLAVVNYLQSLRITPTYLPALSDLARLYLRANRLEEGEQTYRRILAEVDPYHMPAIYNLGDILMTRGRFEEAAAQYESLLSWANRGSLVHQARNNLGLCLQRLGRIEQALAALEQVIRDEPGLIEAQLNRAALLLQMGRSAEAERAYRALLAQDPQSRPVLEGLQTLLRDAGRWDEMADLWERAANSEGSDSPAWAWVAWNRAQGDEPDAATPIAEQCLNRGVGTTLAKLAVFWVAFVNGDYEKAESLLPGVSADSPAQRDRNVELLTLSLESASRRDPDSPWPYYFVGLVTAQQGRADVARLAYREFLRRCKDPAWRAKAEAALAALEAVAPLRGG